MRRFLAVPPNSPAVDFSLLFVRVVAGAAFMLHGWGKIQNPFGWMGPDAFAPGPFQALAALSEFGGGLAWITGLLTRVASAGITCTMLVAIWMHSAQRGDPFVSSTGGPSFELASVYLGIALLLLTLGPGRFSADRALFGSNTVTHHNL